MEYARLEHTQIDLRVHEKDECQIPEACTIHHRTDHHMRSFKQFYRFDRGIMERICTHGIGHPDPDDISIIRKVDDGVHNCDGCCFRFATDEEYNDAKNQVE